MEKAEAFPGRWDVYTHRGKDNAETIGFLEKEVKRLKEVNAKVRRENRKLKEEIKMCREENDEKIIRYKAALKTKLIDFKTRKEG